MIPGMMSARVSRTLAEPNHRQRLALDRIEFAVGELATALLSCGKSRAAACEAIQSIRRSVAPVVSEILEAE
jgi:hypothetical protein